MDIQSTVKKGIRKITLTYGANEEPSGMYAGFIAHFVARQGKSQGLSKEAIQESLRDHQIPEGYWRSALEGVFPPEPDYSWGHAVIPPDPPYRGH